MKRRLKGWSRYFPGIMYGLMISILPWVLLLGLALNLESLNIPTFLAVIGFVICLLGVAVSFLLGYKIFVFTEKKFLKRYEDEDIAHHYAEITEVSSMMAITFIFMIVYIIINS